MERITAKVESGFLKKLLILALPMMLQNLVTFLVGFADNIMVGTLGEAAISGVYLGNQMQTFLSTLLMGIMEGTMVLSTQYWGKRDLGSVRALSSLSFRFSMLLGVLFWALLLFFPRQILGLMASDPAVIDHAVVYTRYLCWSFLFFAASQSLIFSMRSVESVRLGMYASSIALAVNVLLNYLLIFGRLGLPRLGVVGAAIATLLSRIVEFGISSCYVFLRDRKLLLRPRDLVHTNRTLRGDLLRYGLPVFAGQFIWGLNTTIQSSIIGHLGPEATSAVSITMMFFQMLTVVLFAIRAAVSITTGKTIGAGKVEQMKANAVFVQKMFFLLGLACCAIIIVLREPMLMLYNVSPETKEIARRFMLIMAVSMIGTSYQGMCLNCLVKSGGDTKFVFINDTIFIWCLVLPAALLSVYVFHAPVWVTYICLRMDEILKCPVAFIKINRFRWIRRLTREDAAGA